MPPPVKIMAQFKAICPFNYARMYRSNRVENQGADRNHGSAADGRRAANPEELCRATAAAVACAYNTSARAKADCSVFNRDRGRQRAEGCHQDPSRSALDWRSSDDD